MDPFTLAAIGTVAAPIVGGLIGNFASQGDRNSQQAALQQATQELLNLGVPPDISKRIIMEKFQEAGILTPELEQDINLGTSKVSSVQEDPELRERQKQALELISQRAETGLNPEDRAALNEIRNRIASDTEGKRQQIIQQAQARGMGRSGAELIAQLQGAQSGTNQASQEGDNLAAIASKNALQAALQSGQMAGALRSEDYNINRDRAAAEDEFRKFDVQNQMARQARNLQAKNQAQAANLANKQATMNQNVGLENQERLRQANAQRQYWQDQAERAQIRAGGYNQQANAAGQRADRTANQWQGIGSGVGAMVGAFGNAAGKSGAGPSNPAGNLASSSQDPYSYTGSYESHNDNDDPFSNILGKAPREMLS